MTIREHAQAVGEEWDMTPETVADVEMFGRECIKRFREDLLDFIRTQPNHMITRANVLGMIRNLKPEVGQ